LGVNHFTSIGPATAEKLSQTPSVVNAYVSGLRGSLGSVFGDVT